MEASTGQIGFKYRLGTYTVGPKQIQDFLFPSLLPISVSLISSSDHCTLFLCLLKYVHQNVGFCHQTPWSRNHLSIKERQGVKENPRWPWLFSFSGSVLLLETHPKLGSIFCLMFWQRIFFWWAEPVYLYKHVPNLPFINVPRPLTLNSCLLL
jgi:hypothetical protein